jgi:predicted aconitase
MALGQRMEKMSPRPIPYIHGIPAATLEECKAFCASLATYGGAGLFHMAGITPEAGGLEVPGEPIAIEGAKVDQALENMSDASDAEVDFVSLGCPHLSILEIARIAELLRGKTVKRTFWITTARPTKQMADRMGFSQIIEASGAIIAADTCCVVAPIRGRFSGLATDSAKACYYASSKNRFKTRLLPFDQVVAEALR